MEKFIIMDDLKELSKIIYKLINIHPLCKKYALVNQMERAMISTRLNIREGNTFWDNNKIRFFKMALGSLEEVDECIEIANEQNFILEINYYKFKTQYLLCCNKLKKVIKSLRHLVNESN